ncbi:response regulator [Rhodococcus hoagii]|nr:response regulator [Prescottella equi]
MTGTPNTAEGEKILIVDDDPGLSSLLERFFTSKGYRARAVPNTEQMDRLLQREVFNLVVLDLRLPGEDGLSACKRLRQQKQPDSHHMLTAKGDELSASRAWNGRRRLPRQAVQP